jgi:hypothetical protein
VKDDSKPLMLISPSRIGIISIPMDLLQLTGTQQSSLYYEFGSACRNASITLVTTVQMEWSTLMRLSSLSSSIQSTASHANETKGAVCHSIL